MNKRILFITILLTSLYLTGCGGGGGGTTENSSQTDADQQNNTNNKKVWDLTFFNHSIDWIEWGEGIHRSGGYYDILGSGEIRIYSAPNIDTPHMEIEEIHYIDEETQASFLLKVDNYINNFTVNNGITSEIILETENTFFLKQTFIDNRYNDYSINSEEVNYIRYMKISLVNQNIYTLRFTTYADELQKNNVDINYWYDFIKNAIVR